MIISISGTPGSGKNTLANRLADALNYPHYSMGDIRREMAREHGMTVSELNTLGETESWTDHEADDRLKQLGKENPNMVIDSRTAFYFLPESFKVFLDVSEKEGARRIFEEIKSQAKDRNEDVGLQTIEDVLTSNKRRRQSDSHRYKKYYSFDYLDPNNYDFVLDTTNLSADQAFEQLLTAVQTRLKDAQ